MDEGIRAGLNELKFGRKDFRQFGGVLGLLLALWAGLHWRKDPALDAGLLGPAVGALVSWALAAVRPETLKPLVMLLQLVGVVNTYLFLFLFYYCTLTPYAFVLRLCGAKFLDTGFRDRDTYWQPKEPADPASYRHQF